MKEVSIEYDPKINVGAVYYRGTQLCEIQLSESDVKTIKELMKERDTLLDKL